jgi:hypothetical protein
MKDNKIETINQLLVSEKELTTKKLNKAKSRDNVANLKKGLTKEAKVMWPVACNIILKKLLEALNINVADIMVSAWDRCGEVLQYSNKKKCPAGRCQMVHLAEHTIESIHEPSIEIYYNNQPISEINFEITLFLTVEGIVLEITDGRIMKIHTGSCRGGGCIKCEGITILKKKTRRFTLPGTISLGKGIAISKLAA